MENINGDFSYDQWLKFLNFFSPDGFFFSDRNRLTPLNPSVNCYWNNF